MPRPEMRHVLKDAGGWDHFEIIGTIGNRSSYRIAERPDKVWQVEYWNGYQWTEAVTLSVPEYPVEEAVIAANRVLHGWDPRTVPYEEPEDLPCD